MKRNILIFIIFPIFSFSQSYETYKEFNFGLITSVEDEIYNDLDIFPGASFLWGKTHYYNNTVLDYQAGFAFPTLVTGKIGFGVGNSNFATIFGIRPWPSTAYLQFSFKKRFNFSIEYITPDLYGEALLLTYGIRF